MPRNKNIRFGYNNFIDANTTITASTTMTNFPTSNLQTIQRSQVWRPNGNFTINSTNNKLYINDGSDKTITLSSADWSGTTLAAHIQTQLNASSSSWNASYTSSTGKFLIYRSSGTDTLRFTQTSNAVWDTLGLTTQTDESALYYGLSDVARYHTDEYLIFDLGTAVDVQEFHVIGPLSEAFAFSATGTYTLEGNTADSWASPALSISLTRDSGGIHYYLDDEGVSTEYRYWRFKFVDRDNAGGANAFKVGHVYLGDYNTVTTSNVGPGFTKGYSDPSEVFVSEGGARYYKSLTKKRIFSGMTVGFIDTAAERIALEDMFEALGNETPFYCCFDPTNAVTSTLSECTMYGRFTSEPSFVNVIRDVYSMSFAIEEAI